MSADKSSDTSDLLRIQGLSHTQYIHHTQLNSSSLKTLKEIQGIKKTNKVNKCNELKTIKRKNSSITVPVQYCINLTNGFLVTITPTLNNG